MEEYLLKNKEYWDKGYLAENVEEWVFRFYGRILKFEFGLDGSKGNNLLDFGCGSGATLKYFKDKGFNVYGVDISKTDIERTKALMPEIEDHFKVIDAKPVENQEYFQGVKFDVITGIQSVYYFNDTDLQVLLKSFDKMLNPGGIVYFTMMGKKCEMFFANATKCEDGLWNVTFKYPRISCKDYYVNFMTAEEMVEKFKIFEKKHVGFYMQQYREEEPITHHHTFVGKKKD